MTKSNEWWSCLQAKPRESAPLVGCMLHVVIVSEESGNYACMMIQPALGYIVALAVAPVIIRPSSTY
jgi:hypothetical protein